MKLQTARGTRDIFGDEARLFREIDESFAEVAKLYDFEEMETPVFEFTQVFKRTLGEASDIVNKEMYTFEDRSGDSLTLRPEGTAPVARAVVSNSLLRETPLKFFYSGPMFRHERPQKGRYRQFYQFGIELMGVDQSLADIEVIACAWQFFNKMGLTDKVKLEINSIGDQASRDAYRQALVDHFSASRLELSEDSQKRLETNPLRILDSKDDKDKDAIAKAPRFEEYLNEESQKIYGEVLSGLDQLGIPYEKNERLVRGLDYYCHCVFEFTTTALGSQNAVLSGGRYNGLIEQMGGPSTPGVGWAAGMDRLALLLEKPSAQQIKVAVISLDAQYASDALKTMQTMRAQGVACQPIYSGNFSKQMKKASKRGCTHVVMIGEDEVKNQKVSLKNLGTGDQNSLPLSDAITELQG